MADSTILFLKKHVRTSSFLCFRCINDRTSVPEHLTSCLLLT